MPKSRGAERATNGTNSTSSHWVTNIRRLRNLPTSEGCRAAEVMSGKATGINLIGNHAREIVRSSRQYAVSPPFPYRPSFSANAAIRLSCLPATRRRMELGAQKRSLGVTASRRRTAGSRRGSPATRKAGRREPGTGRRRRATRRTGCSRSSSTRPIAAFRQAVVRSLAVNAAKGSQRAQRSYDGNWVTTAV